MTSENENESLEQFPLVDSFDNEILMHRDAHFGGKFDFMIDYYLKDGRGVRDEFSLERIQYLADTEKQLGQNLAATMLSGPEAEKVGKAKEAYKKLRELYELAKNKKKLPTLIADLILAEKEDVESAIAAVVAEKDAIVPSLIELLRSEDFHDPLFPGYGLVPILAVQCLGKIGDKRSIISLFESLNTGDFFDDELALQALRAIGEPAKEFLLKVVKAKPWNEDNEKAAMGLIVFEDDPKVSETCLSLLEDAEIRKKHVLFATYLLMVCEGLKNPQNRTRFEMLSKSPDTPKEMLLDMKAIIKSWN